MRVRVLPVVLVSILMLPTAGSAADGEADVGLALKAPKAPALGEAFNYTLTVANTGPGTARSVKLFNQLPGEVEYQSASWDESLGACTYTNEEYSPPPESESPDAPKSAGPQDAPEYYRYHQLDCRFDSLAPGQTTTVTIAVTRLSAWPIWNGAWAASESFDPNWENDYAESYIDADPSSTADLSVAMTAPKSILAGEQFDYTITASNNGPATAEGVTLNDYLPDGVEYLSSTSSDPTDSCNYQAFPQASPSDESFAPPEYYGFYCDLGSMAPGDSSTVVITVRRTSARELYNSASIYGSSTYDPNWENDYSEVITEADTSNPADVSVSKSVSDDNPQMGDAFDYVVTATNNGPSTAQGVLLNDYLPYEVDFVSVASSDPQDECAFEDYSYYAEGSPEQDAPAERKFGQVNCDLGNMASGESSEVTITVERASAWPIHNGAWATSQSYDPNYENDYAEAFVDADPSSTADVSIKKSAPEAPAEGDQFDYMLEVSNNGPASAQGVVVNDYLPDGVEFVSAGSTDPNDTCAFEGYPGPEPLAPDKGTESRPAYYGFYCDLGTLAHGEGATITLTVSRTGPQALYNSAWVSTTSYDPNYENNYSSVCTDGDNPKTPSPDEPPPPDDDVNSGGGTVESGKGADTIYVNACGDAGEVKVDSGPGSDDIEVELGAADYDRRLVEIAGGPGRDRITVRVGPDSAGSLIVIDAGAGDDEVTLIVAPGGSAARIVIRGGRGHDVLTGGSLADVLRGGPNADLLIGNEGDDRLRGGRGHDTCRGGPGANSSRNC